MKPRTSSTVSIKTAPSNKNHSLTPNLHPKTQQVTHSSMSSHQIPALPLLSCQTSDESILQKATHLVDTVAGNICKLIMSGRLQVDDQESQLKVHAVINNDDDQHSHQQSKSKIVGHMLDQEEHKRLIVKFKHMSKKRDQAMRNKWQQLSQRSIRQQQQIKRQKAQSRMKTLDDRRKQIQKRMQQKKQLMKQISRSILQANSRFNSIKQKKCLYMDKQQQFYKNYTLPKLQQQQKTLQKKHEQMLTPIDIQQLNSHSQNYDKLLADKQVNRNVSMQLLQSRDSQYTPPQFVPKSYLIVQEEEEVKRIQEEIRSKEAEIYGIRRKEYIKKLDQIRQQEKNRSIQKQRSKSQSQERIIKDQPKQKLKPKNRQQMINTGNQYLKQLLKSNRNVALVRKLKPLPQPIEPEKKQTKSPQQKIQQKQVYITEMNKLQNTKIQQIVKSSRMSPLRKQQILQHQITKLDEKVNSKSKKNQTIQDSNNTAGVVLNCIEAKLALLKTVGLLDKKKDKN